jgi:hypothetical protein
MHTINTLCFKYVIVNTLHTGDNKDDDDNYDDDDDDDDNNNNSNNVGNPVDISVHLATRRLVSSTSGPGVHAELI